MDDLDELGSRLRVGIARMYRLFRASRPDGDLGDGAFWVLSHLAKEGPQTLSALSSRENVSAAAMSQTVNRLTSGGYAERIPDPSDGRRVLFRTTDKGTRLAEDARAERGAWLRERLEELDDADRAALSRAADLLTRWAS